MDTIFVWMKGMSFTRSLKCWLFDSLTIMLTIPYPAFHVDTFTKSAMHLRVMWPQGLLQSLHNLNHISNLLPFHLFWPHVHKVAVDMGRCFRSIKGVGGTKTPVHQSWSRVHSNVRKWEALPDVWCHSCLFQPREKGRMRFHKLQNVQIALDFLKHRQVSIKTERGECSFTVWTIHSHFHSLFHSPLHVCWRKPNK